MISEHKKRPRIGYMCLTDFDHELGDASGGTRIFCSVKDLSEHYPCVKECGIAKVEVYYVRTVKKGKF